MRVLVARLAAVVFGGEWQLSLGAVRLEQGHSGGSVLQLLVAGNAGNGPVTSLEGERETSMDLVVNGRGSKRRVVVTVEASLRLRSLTRDTEAPVVRIEMAAGALGLDGCQRDSCPTRRDALSQRWETFAVLRVTGSALDLRVLPRQRDSKDSVFCDTISAGFPALDLMARLAGATAGSARQLPSV